MINVTLATPVPALGSLCSMILPIVGVVGWSRYYGIYGMWVGETDWTLLDFGRVRDQRLDFHVFEA